MGQFLSSLEVMDESSAVVNQDIEVMMRNYNLTGTTATIDLAKHSA